jgi:hypothetical protein
MWCSYTDVLRREETSNYELQNLDVGLLPAGCTAGTGCAFHALFE